MLLVKQLGLWSMGVSIILLAVLGLLLAWPKLAAPIVAGERLPFIHVLGKVFPHGCGLALGSIGFGTIATFITLYYATRDWSNAVLALSLFGASFIGARLLFGNLINRLGAFGWRSPAWPWKPWACCCCGWPATRTGPWPEQP